MANENWENCENWKGGCLNILSKNLMFNSRGIEMSHKIAFPPDTSLQDTFINPIGGLYKRLFPLDHRSYLSVL
jgi:hypothetical protein